MARGGGGRGGRREHAVVALDPALVVGRPLELRVKGKALTLTIVGVVKEMSPAPVAYAPEATILAATGQPAGMARTLRVVTRGHDAASQLAAKQELDRLFEREGIGVDDIQPLADRRRAFEDHLVIIQSALLLASRWSSTSAPWASPRRWGSTSPTGRARSGDERDRRDGAPRSPATSSPRGSSSAPQLGRRGRSRDPISWLFDATTDGSSSRRPLDFAMSPARGVVSGSRSSVVLAAASSAFPARRPRAWPSGRPSRMSERLLTQERRHRRRAS